MKGFRCLSIVLLLVFALSPLTTFTAAAQEPEGGPVKIILVSHGSCAWDAFWCVVEKGAKDAAKAMNVDLTIIAPDAFAPEKTAQDIDKALAMKPDALGVTVTDGVLFQEPMLRAIKTGIPVLAYNAADWRPIDKRIPYKAYIGQDEYLAGQIAAERMHAKFGGKQAVCVNPAVGHVGTDTRCVGWTDALKKYNIKSEVLAITYEASEAATTMGDYFTANPDVDLWLVQGTGGQDPFYSFLEAAKVKAGTIHQAGFDLSPKVAAHIKDGTTELTIDQQPYLQGFMVVQWLSWMKRFGFSPPGDTILTGPGVVDASNVDVVSTWAGKVR